MSAEGQQWAGKILWYRIDVEWMVHEFCTILMCVGDANPKSIANIPHFNQFNVGIDCHVCGCAVGISCCWGVLRCTRNEIREQTKAKETNW